MDEGKIKELIQQSRLEMPFADFEERVMQSVYKEEKSRRGILKNIRLSWLFFTIGALFGIVATISLPHIKQSVLNIEMEYIQLPLLLVISGAIIWMMDAMLRFSYRNSRK